MGLFALAEVLHKPMYEMRQMPMSEYMDWTKYFAQKNKDQGPRNLIDGNNDDLIKGLTGG
jgi:hypothetical protein